MIAVNLDVARFAQFKRNWPLDFADLPSGRQLPFQLGGNSGVAWKFPISMPAGSHSKQQTDSKRFPGNNCVCIRQEFCFDELLSLVSLAPGERAKSEDRQTTDRVRGKSGCRHHSITYHSRKFAAISRGRGASRRRDRAAIYGTMKILFVHGSFTLLPDV